VAEACAKAMGELPEVGALVLAQDAPTGLGEQQAARYATLLGAVARGAEAAGKPLVALTNLSDEPHPELARVAREHSVPYLRGTREGLNAIARYARWSTRPPKPAPVSSKTAKAVAQRQMVYYAGRTPAEHEARKVLACYGIAGPKETLVATAGQAANAAMEMGFPVVLKGIVPGVIHKSDAGLVKLRLTSPEAVNAAAKEMKARAYLVQKMEFPVAEIFVGARVDPEFGPLIVVGAGGINVELYKDVAVRIAPISEDEALAALAATKISRVLDGWRGAPPGDKKAAAKGIAAMSRFIADFQDEIQEVEINPFAVFAEGKGCLALDAVIVAKEKPA